MHALVLLLGSLLQAASAQDPLPPLRLKGRVVDVQGQPLAGAGFVIGAPGQALTAAALEQPLVRTGADGRFELSVPRLPEGSAGTPSHVLVAAPGKAALRWPQHELELPPERLAEGVEIGDLVLPDGVTVRGQVRGEGGRPLGGARVRCADLIGVRPNLGDGQGGSGRLFASYGVTKDDGSFQLVGVFPTLLEVRVDAPGYHSRSVAPVTARDPLVLELTPSGFVDGRLVDADGKPQAGAVSIQYEVEHYTQDLATGPDGSFHFPVRFPARFRLHAWVPGEQHKRGAESDVLTGPTQGIELRLKPPEGADKNRRHLLVRARDAAGQPAAKFRACALWVEAGNFDPTYLQNLFDQGMVEADAQGLATLDGPGEDDHPTATVRVLAPGLAPITVADVTLKDEGDTPLEVKLKPQCALEGLLRDPRSKEPVVGAEVRVVAIPDGKPGQPLVMLGGTGNQLGRIVRTDAAGKFRVEQLGAGRHEVFARSKDRPETKAQELTLAEGETRGGLEFELARGATLRGRVLGQTPGIGWKVRLEPLEPGAEVPFEFMNPMAAADLPGLLFDLAADGSFVAPGLRRGNYQVHLLIPVDPRAGRPLSLPIEPIRIRSNDLKREFDASEDQPALVSGRITVQGATLPPERLLVGVLQGQAEGRAWFGGFGHGAELNQRRSPVDGEGRFQLPLGPGTYQLAVVDAGTGVRLLLDDQRLEVKAGARLTRELKAVVVKVRVRLVREGGGRALASRLQVEAGPREDGGPNFNEGYDSGLGLDLAEGPEEVTLFVPPGPAKLLVHAQPWRLMRGARNVETKPLGDAELDAQPGEMRTVELKVQPPPEIPDEKGEEGKAGKGAAVQFEDVGVKR